MKIIFGTFGGGLLAYHAYPEYSFFGAVVGFGFSCVLVMITERASVVQAVCYPGVFGLITIDLTRAFSDDLWVGVLMSIVGAIIGSLVLIVKSNPINESKQNEDIT